MRQDKKRLYRITEELMNVLFDAGATEVRTLLHRDGSVYRLMLDSDYRPEKQRDLEELREYFGRSGQYGAAEEYWELIGDQAGSGSELMLLGMLVSQAEIRFDQGRVRITLEIRP